MWHTVSDSESEATIFTHVEIFAKGALLSISGQPHIQAGDIGQSRRVRGKGTVFVLNTRYWSALYQQIDNTVSSRSLITMSRYYRGYEEEDELDVHITRQRSRSPAPPFYGEVRHTRPPIHESYSYGAAREYERAGGYLIPAGGRQRAYSTGRRTPSPVAPPPQPVIINNKIYNERDDEDDYYHHHHSQLAPFEPRRRRASSFNAPPDHSREEWELEQARKQLANYKLEEDKAAERKRVQKEIELERLRKEKEEEEEEEKLKAERKRAIEKYKAEELQRIAKEKKEKEDREREYKERLAADMRKSGVDEKQIALVLKGEAAKPPPPKEANRPIFTRMSRRHLSIETLNKFRVEYEFDHVS